MSEKKTLDFQTVWRAYRALVAFDLDLDLREMLKKLDRAAFVLEHLGFEEEAEKAEQARVLITEIVKNIVPLANEAYSAFIEGGKNEQKKTE